MLRWALVLVMTALPVAAQEAGATAGLTAGMTADVAAALAGLPEAQVRRLRADPDRFAAGALRLIYGHGTEGAVTREAAEGAALVDLAERRARALGPFLQSDLDNDGAVGRDEVALRAGTLGSEARARLLAGFAQADADADGSVSAAELRAMAEVQAAPRGGGAASYFVFDLDEDGRLTVAEVEAVRADLAAGP